MKRHYQGKEHQVEPKKVAPEKSTEFQNLLSQSKDLISKSYETRNKILNSYQMAIATDSALVASQLLSIISENLAELLKAYEDCMFMARYLCITFDRCLKKNNAGLLSEIMKILENTSVIYLSKISVKSYINPTKVIPYFLAKIDNNGNAKTENILDRYSFFTRVCNTIFDSISTYHQDEKPENGPFVAKLFGIMFRLFEMYPTEFIIGFLDHLYVTKFQDQIINKNGCIFSA